MEISQQVSYQYIVQNIALNLKKYFFKKFTLILPSILILTFPIKNDTCKKNIVKTKNFIFIEK